MADSTSPSYQNENITVGDAENILSQLPQDAVAAETWLAPLVDKIAAALKQSAPGSVKTVDDLALKLYDLEKGINANAQAVANLTNQFSPLTFPVKGVHLQGTGQLVHTFQSVPEGLKSAMTREQHVLHVVAGILQVVFLLTSVGLYFVPSLGGAAIGGGVTLVGLIEGIKNILTPFLAQYGDSNIPAALVPVAAPALPAK